MTIDINPCVTCAHKESRPNGNPCWKCIDFKNDEIIISAKFYKKRIITNADYIRSMSDEELAEYLFYSGNGSEYCYGICAYQDKCKSYHPSKFCISQIVEWLKQESKK